MRAAFFAGPRSIEVTDRPDPVIVSPTDAVVRVVLSCVCGSDLWYYRGESPHALGPIGHEFIGVVEQVGAEVLGVASGDFVVAPFTYCDGTCAHCRAGVTSQCVAGGSFGNHGIDGGQGEAVRVPLASSTLVRVPGSGYSDETMRSLLTLSDVMCAGHHAAVSAGVRRGQRGRRRRGRRRGSVCRHCRPAPWRVPDHRPQPSRARYVIERRDIVD